MQSQIDKKILSEDEEFKSRDFLMDRAYEALVVFVEDLLKYTDGTAEIGSGGVPSLPIVVQCFKSLAEYCEKVIDEEGLQAVEATQEIGEDGQVVEQINSLRTKLQSDMNGLRDAVSSAETYFNEVHGHHMIAREELRNAEERKEVIYKSLFFLTCLLHLELTIYSRASFTPHLEIVISIMQSTAVVAMKTTGTM